MSVTKKCINPIIGGVENTYILKIPVNMLKLGNFQKSLFFGGAGGGVEHSRMILYMTIYCFCGLEARKFCQKCFQTGQSHLCLKSNCLLTTKLAFKMVY